MRGDSAAYAVMDYGGNEFPSNIGVHLAFNFKSAHLFVERIEELLTGCSTSKGGASFLRTAESAQVKQTLRGSIEHYAHAVEHVDDFWGGFAHGAYLRLVRQKVATVNGVVEVLVYRITFTFGVQRGVYAPLRTGGMRALEGNERKQVNAQARFYDFQSSHQPRKASANNCD